MLIGDDSKKDSGMCKTMIDSEPENLSERQIAYSLRILYRFYIKGFNLPNSLKKSIEENEKELMAIEKKRLKNFSTSKYFVKAKL